MAIIEACKEAIWLKGLFSELSDNLKITIVFCDCQRVLFSSQKIRCFMRRQSTLMCGIILCVISLLMVILLWPKLAPVIILLIWWWRYSLFPSLSIVWTWLVFVVELPFGVCGRGEEFFFVEDWSLFFLFLTLEFMSRWRC